MIVLSKNNNFYIYNSWPVIPKFYRQYEEIEDYAIFDKDEEWILKRFKTGFYFIIIRFLKELNLNNAN